MEKKFLDNKKVDSAKWSFKSLQQLVLILLKLKKTSEVLPVYKELLAYKGADANENLLSKAINSILDAVASVEDDELSAAEYKMDDALNKDVFIEEDIFTYAAQPACPRANRG